MASTSPDLAQSMNDLAGAVKGVIDELHEAVKMFWGIVTGYQDALSSMEMSGALAGPVASAEAAVAVACEQGKEGKDWLDNCLREIPKRRSRVTEALARVAQLMVEIQASLIQAKAVAEVTAHDRVSPYGKHLEASQRCWSEESKALAQFLEDLQASQFWAHKEIEQAESKME